MDYNNPQEVIEQRIDPPNVPFLQHQFNREEYNQWEQLPEWNQEEQKNYAPFGKYEKVPIQGAPSMEQIWPLERIGKEWMEQPPQERALSLHQEKSLSDHLIKDVNFIQKLGTGAFGEVWQVTADWRPSEEDINYTRKQFACKVTRFKVAEYPAIYKSMSDMLILRYLRHENICNICDIIGIPDRLTGFPYSIICTFLELCDGDFFKILDLYLDDILAKLNPSDFGSMMKKKLVLPERLSRHWFAQIVRALAYIHRNDVIHRDMKEDNILFKIRYHKTDSFEDKFLSSIFKLTDFGISRSYHTQSQHELKQAMKGDLYVLYQILFRTGIPGNRGINQEQNFLLYCREDKWFEENPSEWTDLSHDFKSLISNLEPKNQILTAEDILYHPWLQNNNESQTEEFIERLDDFSESFLGKSFNYL